MAKEPLLTVTQIKPPDWRFWTAKSRCLFCLIKTSFKDSYGREGKPYEDSTFEYPKEDDCVWLEGPPRGAKNVYDVGNSKLSVVNIDSSSYFDNLKDEQNVMFLQGGLKTDYDVTVAGAGDVVSVKVLKQLKEIFSEIHDNTLILLMEK